MGRRSLHTADELRELIIGASTELIRESGFAGLSAREIARKIDYSPGTIYNSFENLDDLVLTIEGRLLDDLLQALSEVSVEDPRDHMHALAARYLAFVRQNPNLWNLLFAHHVPGPRAVPEWYRPKLEAVIKVFETALAGVMGRQPSDETDRIARALWAGTHGIASLVTADKLSSVAAGQEARMMDDLVSCCIAGLGANHGEIPGRRKAL